VLEVRVDHISEELLKRLDAVALNIQHEEDKPDTLLIEIAQDEQSADIADIIHACGARLYTLAPRHLSLEQIFFQTIDALHQEN
jgi:ABC-2 type transport system ATP-binding protein